MLLHVAGATGNRARIQSVSTMLRHCCTAVAVLIPLGAAVYWAVISPDSQLLPSMIVNLKISLTPLNRLIALLITLLPTMVVVWAFLCFRRLFTLYAAGEYFSAANVRCFRQLGFAALVWTAANLLYGALLSMSLTLANAPGQRAIAISASGVDLTALFAGAALLVVSWVMEEARRLDEDQSQIV